MSDFTSLVPKRWPKWWPKLTFSMRICSSTGFRKYNSYIYNNKLHGKIIIPELNMVSIWKALFYMMKLLNGRFKTILCIKSVFLFPFILFKLRKLDLTSFSFGTEGFVLSFVKSTAFVLSHKQWCSPGHWMALRANRLEAIKYNVTLKSKSNNDLHSYDYYWEGDYILFICHKFFVWEMFKVALKMALWAPLVIRYHYYWSQVFYFEKNQKL